MNRYYIRGWTPLGLFNTITACVFNRVLVKVIDHQAAGWDMIYTKTTYHWENAEKYDKKIGRY